MVIVSLRVLGHSVNAQQMSVSQSLCTFAPKQILFCKIVINRIGKDLKRSGTYLS